MLNDHYYDASAREESIVGAAGGRVRAAECAPLHLTEKQNGRLDLLISCAMDHG